MLAGLLVERLTGARYGSAVTERIIEPLRLNHTTVPGTEPGLPEPHAHGYTEVSGELVDATETDPSLGWAAGEMISTAGDLNRFVAALLGFLTYAMAPDDARRLTPSYNPLRSREGTTTTIIGLFSRGFCPPAP